MSTLSSRLFSANDGADSGLDDIFKSSAGAAIPSKPLATSSTKRSAEDGAPLTEVPKKRAKTEKSKKGRAQAERPSETNAKATKKGKNEAQKTRDSSASGKPQQSSSSEEKKAKSALPSKERSKRPGSRSEVKSDTKKKGKQKSKYVPPGEKPEDVDARTVFVGNLPASMVKNNSSMKSLVRHLTSTLPAHAKARVESTRFRSVAFNQSTKSSKDGSNDQVEAEESDEDGATKQDTLTSSQKKRLAFLKGEMNEKAEVVNCYVVFGHHRSAFVDEGVSKAKDVEKPMLPSEVAELVARAADGTTFMDRVIRVDRVGAAKSVPGSSSRDEMKRTVFVGSLDFEAHEDDVRNFFEELLAAERGDALEEGEKAEDDVEKSEDEDEDEDEGCDEPKGSSTSKRTGWVQSVRIVRDPDSQLGKGIAYVQLKDVQCVDELLALPSTKLSFRKRTLRLQRCKTLPRSSSSKDSYTHDAKSSKSSPGRSPSKQSNSRLPKGDPGLGARIVELSKEERKEAKALDTDRVARRLAKKKQRGALDKEKWQVRRTGAKESILGKMPKSTKPKNPSVKKAKKLKK